MKYLLILICIFFLITRLYKINEVPVSVYWDEASIGYNAYSLAETGKDEWGKAFPIHFRAFGEFKLPVYIYTTVVFVKLLGLGALAVRLPAVFFSLGVVILTYFLARKLSDNVVVGLWSSFFMTISPWFFIFSRTGYEVTAGLMFYLLAIFLFLHSKKKGKFILLSIISFILSAYSYNSFRIVSPLTILLLAIFESRNIKEILSKQKIYIAVSFIFLFLAAIPIARLYIYDAGILRLQTVGSVSGLTMFKNYLSHFNPYFLFINGDSNLRHQQAGFGQLYLPESILLAAALVYVLKSRTRYTWLVLAFILMGPIPAAITKESPHGLRSLSILPFICYFSATGAFYLGQIFKKNLINLAMTTIFLTLFGNYFINFLFLYPVQSAKYWQYNYKKIFMNLRNKPEEKQRILISDKDGQPYIFALFYLKYDPENFRREVVRNSVDKWGFSTVKRFGRFEFGQTYER